MRHKIISSIPFYRTQLGLFPIGEKLCPRCELKKPVADFSRRSVTSPQPCSYCRSCQRRYCRRHYLQNRELHNSRRCQRQQENRVDILRLPAEHKRGTACVDCGERDPVVLEFDHVKGRKEGNISRMVCTSTWDRIKEEIKKCEIRCANCHRRRTAKQLGWKVSDSLAEHLK